MAITLNGSTGITNDGGYTGDGVSFADTTPSNTLVTTTGGNVGIGVASPSQKLDVDGAVLARSGVYLDDTNPHYLYSGGTSQIGVRFNDGATATGYMWLKNFAPSVNGIGVSSGSLAFGTANTERMRIDSSGNLLVGTTSSAGNFKLQVVNTDSSSNALWLQNNSGNDRGIAVFKHGNATGGTTGNMASFQNASGTTVGSIVSSNTATSFNTSSDYRLKDSIAPMTDALAVVGQLKPCTYKWKSDGSDGQGFIAHELQSVVPDAVVGEKDAVDADGNPVYQGIDTSFLVATLTAAIQEQQAIITDLKSRIEALEQV